MCNEGKLMKSNMKNAFTLSEVLITLGIIGVVASLTMPSLIKNYRHRVLKTQFAKSYSILSQILEEAKIEYNDCNANNTEEIKALVYENLNKVQGKILTNKDPNIIFDKYKQYSLTGVEANVALHTNCLIGGQVFLYAWGPVYQAITADGAFVGLCSHARAGSPEIAGATAYSSGHGTFITVDTNGLKKPNRFGEDIFGFHVNSKTCKLEEAYSPRTMLPDEDGYNDGKGYTVIRQCSLTDKTSDANGFPCAVYAIMDKCPNGSNRSYWECIP